MRWEEAMLGASLARHWDHFERLYEEHIKSPEDLEQMLYYLADEVFHMSRAEMRASIAEFVARKMS